MEKGSDLEPSVEVKKSLGLSMFWDPFVWTFFSYFVSMVVLVFGRCKDRLCGEREDLEDHPNQHYHQQGTEITSAI